VPEYYRDTPVFRTGSFKLEVAALRLLAVSAANPENSTT
jgi:hypothetical protein